MSINKFMIKAIVNYDGKSLKRILKAGANVNFQTPVKRQTPLMYAAVVDNDYAAVILIENGADVYAKDYLGRTELDYAKYYESDEVQCLLNIMDMEELEYGDN